MDVAISIKYKVLSVTMWVETLVESAVVGGAENACLLGDREHRLLPHRFPRELHVA